MMPGRRNSDSTDVLGGITAASALLLILLMAWATVIFFAAGSWAFFLHCLRLWGAA